MESKTVSKNDKVRILEAYFEKSISKDEMELLLKYGIVFSPIPWIFNDPERENQEAERRKLICRVFGLSDSKVEWV
jgi:hypothetical protein